MFDADLEAGIDAPARRVGGRLRVLRIVNQTRHHLHVALSLHRTTHDAEAHQRFAVFAEKARDDGLKRTFARGDDIGMTRFQVEAVAAVLQADAGAGHHDAGAEAGVVGLDVRHHHARLIGCRQVDRAACGRMAERRVLRLFHIDQLRTFFQVRLVEHFGGRDAHGCRIGNIFIDIGEGEFHRFDLQVHAVRGIHRQLGDIEVLENAQRDQRRDALAVGRNFMQRVAAVIDADRFHPVVFVIGQIVHRHRAAILFGPGNDFFGEVACVKRFTFGLGDPRQGFGLSREGEFFTRCRRAPARHEGFSVSWLIFQFRRLLGPQAGDGRRHHITVGGVFDRGFEQVGEGQLAELGRHFRPGRDTTRHGDGIPAALRHRLRALEIIRGPRRGRAS